MKTTHIGNALGELKYHLIENMPEQLKISISFPTSPSGNELTVYEFKVELMGGAHIIERKCSDPDAAVAELIEAYKYYLAGAIKLDIGEGCHGGEVKDEKDEKEKKEVKDEKDAH